MIEIRALGGYDEIGRNMTAVRVDDEVVVFDCGLYLEPILADEETHDYSTDQLLSLGALPQIQRLREWKEDIVALIPTHAHLDHVGGIPFLAPELGAPIICTPFTAEVIRSIVKDRRKKIPNEIKELAPTDAMPLTKNLSIEFIRVTHSTPQTVIAVLHTKYGAIVYANDFKLDDTPLLGYAPDYNSLEALTRKKGVVALICDSTNANVAGTTPSEAAVKTQLQELCTEDFAQGKAIIVSTFSSHIERIDTLVKCAQRLGRIPLFLGRSMRRYILAAEKVGIVNFSQRFDIAGFASKIKRKLNKVVKDGKDKYFIIATGHQGEPGSVLQRLSIGEYPLLLEQGDHIIFSSRIIPTPINEEASRALDETLGGQGATIHRGIHSSGHASQDDLKRFISLLKPAHFIPAHGYLDKRKANAQNAKECGVERVHMVDNGQNVVID